MNVLELDATVNKQLTLHFEIGALKGELFI